VPHTVRSVSGQAKQVSQNTLLLQGGKDDFHQFRDTKLTVISDWARTCHYMKIMNFAKMKQATFSMFKLLTRKKKKKNNREDISLMDFFKA
jgi:hypothetical protein